MMRGINVRGAAVVCIGLAQISFGQIPKTLSYQGVLTDSAGTPKPDGTYTFTFSLYQASAGGSALWSEQKTLQLAHGLFSTSLGDQVIFPSSLTFDRQYWLGIQAGTNPEMTPRVQLTSAGYSLRSLRADTAQYALVAGQGVTGSGTSGFVPKWTSNGSELGNSLIQDFGTSINIGPFVPGGGLTIQGKLDIGVSGEEVRALRLSSGPNAFLDITPSGSSSTVFSTVNNRNVVFHMGMGKFRLEKGSGGVASASTDAGFIAENNDASGNSGWFYNQSQSNTDPVLKLHKHPSSTANFIDGYAWDGSATITREFHITSAGSYVAGSDFAEAFEAKDDKSIYEPGDVVVLCDDGSKEVEKSTAPYDTRVAGIYSTRPGVLGADKDGVTRMDANDIPVAIIGIVPTKVNVENGAIRSGDLLTTSSSPGRAMKASPMIVGGMKIYPTGAIIGKALEPLMEGEGVIKVLVTIR